MISSIIKLLDKNENDKKEKMYENNSHYNGEMLNNEPHDKGIKYSNMVAILFMVKKKKNNYLCLKMVIIILHNV